MTATEQTPISSVSMPTQVRAEQVTHRNMLIWISVGLALAAALSYVAMALGWLETNVVLDEAGKVIPWVAAGGYALGALLILLRRRWLWIVGWVINTLVIWMFFSMHAAEPQVLWSAGGIVSKSAQILLALALLDLIVVDWRMARRTPAA
ncbi:MAG: hypothetical protein ACRC1H_04155 [Caldilineaceae bacterium]